MNNTAETITPYLPFFIGGGLVLGFLGIVGWIFTTWLRVRHGYPLESSWGKAIYPQKDAETVERVKLLTQENGQLRAELSAVKDRLVNVERIVTDGSLHLTHEIERLRGSSN
jgi:hypothetical protein